MRTEIRLATDVGGTFTDLVFYEVDPADGRLHSIRSTKAHTTPPNFEQGVLDTLTRAEIDPRDVTFFAHGSTVVINALTERKGVKTGLITTRGFRDILEIGRGDRPDYFNLRYKKPEAFVPRHLRFEMTERMTFKGDVRQRLLLDELDPILEAMRREDVRAVAVSFLHAYANPAHEAAVMAAIKARWPEVTVAASHQISREWREYERTNTAVLSAYVQPIAVKYLDGLASRLKEDGFDGSLYVMQSNGGVDTIDAARITPITMVESGPASGVLGAAVLGRLIGEDNILALDIGGTTAKCSLIDKGRVLVTSKYEIERSRTSPGYPIMTPVVDIVEIGNGGGSIAWIDEAGRMHVGPKSAGALPGPVAYGKGGTQPTTTDANLLTGRISPDYFLGGEIVPDMANVRTCFDQLGERLGLDAEATACGVIRIANHNMVNALKLVSINRGYDPRDFTLVAFGGGGAMHAAALARELNIPKVIIPANSAVFSAWGMLMSDLRRDYIQTRPVTLNEGAADEIERMYGEMEDHARQAFEADGFDTRGLRFERHAQMRYEGQEHAVTCLLPDGRIDGARLPMIVDLFNTAYRREYTYTLNNPITLIAYHLVAIGHIEQPPIARSDPGDPDAAAARKGARIVDYDSDGKVEAAIYDRDLLKAGMAFAGPAIIEESGTTTVVLPGQTVRVDQYSNLHISL